MTYLDIRAGRIYCDATLGGGGHAMRILELSSPDGRVVGIDRDEESLSRAGERLSPFGSRAQLVWGDFGDAVSLLQHAQTRACDGFLLDLGISSMQLDDPTRGFSFSHSGPLDMRMDRSQGETAADLLRRWTSEELAEVLHRYGEQPAARRVARAIKEALGQGQIESSTDLASVVARCQRRYTRLHPATRVFMALRIAVNRELQSLDRFLETFLDGLVIGGRVVVIAFHSLEDRLVKHRFRALSRPDPSEQAGARLRLLTKKPIRPGAAEVSRNPRARSARLRAAERIS